MTSRSSAGGAAVAGGVDYQALVSGYMAVRILAESALSPLWELPETVTLVGLWAESQAAVDDVLVTTSAHGHVFIQAKRTVGMSDSVESTIGEAFMQFVALYRDAGTVSFPGTNERRVLDPSRDRIVLATSATTGPLEHFIAVLRRVREMGSIFRPRECATTGEERLAFARGLRLVRRCWQAKGGAAPSWPEMMAFLKLVRITTMRLEPDEPEEQNAKYWLRDRILVRAADAEGAWKLLKDKAIGLAKRKSGVDRAELQRTLTSATVALRALRSYDADIERLGEHTRTNLSDLMRFARIRYDGIEITIRREYEAVINKEAEVSSLLIVGDAGSGKSGLLAVFSAEAIKAQRHVVVLNAGELNAASLGELRNEIGLEHELTDVLENWLGEGAAFLVIDALDSAREERTAATLRRFIERVQSLESRWRVVATIRKFDLKNGKHWQKILPGKGIRPHFDPAFDDVRHLNIGVLTPTDIDSLKGPAPALHAMVTSAPEVVAQLLRVPFNLMLANELRLAGGANDLSTITTQLELLDRYWDRRLAGSLTDRDGYEAILREITEGMLHNRQLYVTRVSVASTPPLQEMLSRSVLLEHVARLHFAHHILFDYAAERLLLRPSSDKAIARLEADRDLPITIGPSLKFWLEGTWERDPERMEFWALAFKLVSSSAPAIVKLISGTVAAEKTEGVADCKDLLATISRDVGQRVFMFAADAVTANVTRVVRKRPNPWFFVLEQAAATALSPVLHRGVFLLHELLNTIAVPTNEELAAGGRFARSALRQAWSSPVRNRSFVVSSIRAVARTFRSNVDESESLLRSALLPEHVAQHGHEELRWLADSALEFVKAPDFLIDLYAVSFQATASADEQTAMSNSQIFGLLSTKKQDLEGALWQLGEQFVKIANHDIGISTAIAVRLANEYASDHSSDAASVITFEIQGATATFHVDRHFRRVRESNEEPRIIEQWVHHLSDVATDPKKSSALSEAIRFTAYKNRSSLMWAKLAESMAGSLAMFAVLHEMLFSKDALSLFTRQFIAALRAHQAWLPLVARARIESAILSLRDSGYGDMTALRLFGAFGRAGLSSETLTWLEEQDKEQARARLDRGQAVHAAEGDEDETDDGAVTYTLRTMGMTTKDLTSDANLTARNRTRELRSRVSALGNSASVEVLASTEEVLRDLQDYLATAPIHVAQIAQTWGALAEAATALAERGVDSVQDILIQASERPEPIYKEEIEKQFSENPGWSSGEARIEVVPGLFALARRNSSSDVLRAIEKLAQDKVSTVRFQVGRALSDLGERHRDIYWKLLDALANDRNQSVVSFIDWGYALRADPPRALALLMRAYQYWLAHRKRHHELVESLFCTILSHALISSDTTAKAIVETVADDPVANAELASHSVRFVRDALTIPRESNGEMRSEQDDVRRQAIAYVARVTARSMESFRRLVGEAAPSEADHEQLGQAAKLLRDIAQEMYFASLAYDEDHPNEQKAKPDRQVRLRFYVETKSILQTLAEVGTAGSAHYLVETLASYVDLVDPAEVFMLIAKAVHAGRKGGYQYESLAVKEIVKIVERYLADFRVLFVEREDCRAALREVLDTFVEAGWPETHQLVYSLDAIFR